MPDAKITELTAIDSIVAADLIAMVDDVAGTPITKKATFTQLLTFLDANVAPPFSQLSDVTITGIASGEIPKWNGSAWINNTLAEAGISATGHTHTESDITDLGTTVAMVADNLSVFASTTKAQLEGIMADVSDFAEADGDTYSGNHDFSSATIRVPLSATPTMAVDGDFAIDTTVTDLSHGLLKYYDGEEMGVVAMPIAQYTTPTDGYVIAYNATNDEFELVAQTGGSTLPVADTTSIVEGSVDDTKELRIEVDGLTTATTRVWTAQDTDMTVAGNTNKLDFFASTTKAELESVLGDVTDLAEADGDTYSGAHNFSSATMRIPLSATPTMAVDGDFAIDTTITDISHGLIKYYDGEELAVVSMPIAQLTTPTDGYVIAYNATNDEFELVAQSGGGDTVIGTQQFYIPAGNFKPTATSGCAGLTTRELGANNQNIEAMQFLDGSDTYAYTTLVMPENYDAGTIKFKYYWFRENDEATPESKTVAFDMAGVAIDNFEGIGGTAYGTAVQVIDTTDTVTAEEKIMESGQSTAITIAGTPTDSSLISLRIMRDDSAGTMTGTAYLVGVMIEYTIDAGTSSG